MYEIEYGVFVKERGCNEWKRYYIWSSNYEDAYNHYKQALENHRYKAAKIVKIDAFSFDYLDVEVKEKNDDKS